MNTASLEVCKELYGLSQWGDTEFAHEERFVDGLLHKVALHQNVEFEDNGKTYGKVMRNIYPAYDLGYLLRKLQDQKRVSVSRLLIRNKWVASCMGITKNCESNNPEDALCILAIELFKQGILK